VRGIIPRGKDRETRAARLTLRFDLNIACGQNYMLKDELNLNQVKIRCLPVNFGFTTCTSCISQHATLILQFRRLHNILNTCA
jgi:hypothetical protein